MNTSFGKLHLTVKLLLIGCIPLVFIIYLTFEVYQEKQQKVDIIKGYIERIQQSGNISTLISEMQNERKLSFDVAMRNKGKEELISQRAKTDATLKVIEKSNDIKLKGFESYTYLHKLPEVRAKVDSGKANTDMVTHYYSNMIFRLNTLTGITLANNSRLQPVYKDMTGQKLLSEMIAYLSIIRSNIYNVLYTRKYMVETLIGTLGTHDVYNSYETEFLMKASPEAVADYKNLREHSEFKPTIEYINHLFATFKFDSTYTADEWWAVSDKGIGRLSTLQQQLWNKVVVNMTAIYRNLNEKKNNTLLFLVIAFAVVLVIISYTIVVITRQLRELKVAAEKIANGGAGGIQIQNFPHDVIGSLAQSVHKIEKNNLQLAEAAADIGKGNFSVAIQPRSKEDMLANALVQMQQSLQVFSEKMELLVKQRTEELERSNNDLQQFAHVASHDLKEPLRKIRIFGSRLHELYDEALSEKGQEFLDKILSAADRMTRMVDGILNYSTTGATDNAFEQIDLNKVCKEIVKDLELVIQQKNAVITFDNLPCFDGMPVLIHQLFYNLIINALKFSKEDVQPVITITAQQIGGKQLMHFAAADPKAQYFEIEIKDNGIGFDTDQTAKLFTIFTRLHVRDKYEGTGLGLALCKKIVDRHNGFIYAEGKQGEGASFKIILPVATESIPESYQAVNVEATNVS